MGCDRSSHSAEHEGDRHPAFARLLVAAFVYGRTNRRNGPICQRNEPRAHRLRDNCYGEFTELQEPTQVGVDLMAGSLIKNPGGGIAPSGGYIAGTTRPRGARRVQTDRPGHRGRGWCHARRDASDVSRAYSLPRIWWDKRSRARSSPQRCSKSWALRAIRAGMRRGRILIQAIRFTSAEHLITFVQGIQKAAAVDSHVVPEPWDMPGYEHPVIMAAGTFIQGGSLELSADAPIREPYIAYMQGGLNLFTCKLGVLTAIQHMVDKGLL